MVGNVVGQDGRGFGIYDVGMLAQMCWTFLNHLNFNTIIRHYNRLTRTFVLVTIFAYVTVIFNGNRVPGLSDNFYQRAPEVLLQPLYWLTLVPTLALSILPYYLEKCYWNLWRFPQIRSTSSDQQ